MRLRTLTPALSLPEGSGGRSVGRFAFCPLPFSPPPLSRQRQAESEGAALAGLAHRPDSAPVSLHDEAGGVESELQSLGLSCRAAPVEALKRVGRVGRRDANAVVFDREDGLGFASGQPDGYRSVGRG